MENTSRRLMLGCSATALLLSLGTAAQAQNEETMIVSSTRLQNAGFDAPTPTTVVGIEDIQRVAQPNVFEAMTQLPALQGSTGVSYNTGSTTTGLMGLSALNLRALGVLRTLVLIDNQRVVGGNPNGAVDVSQIPQALIQRVDIVTGGASASWGSDAVAGVVNFVTDKRFEGFKANLMGGQTTYGDNSNALFQFAAGTSFLGDKAHVQVAGEYSYSAGVYPRQPISGQFGTTLHPGGRDFFSQYGTDNYGTPTAAVFATCGATNSCPAQNYYGNLAQNIINYPYGMIISGPKQGTIFGHNGQAAQFDYAGGCTPLGNGSATGQGGVTGAIGSTCFGTAADPGDQTARQFTHTLVSPLTRGNIYSRLSYEIAPGTEVYGTVSVSSVRTQSVPAQGNSNRNGIAVKCDNAFLPDSGAFGIGLSYAQTIANCNALYAASGFNGVTAQQITNFNSNPINTLTTYTTPAQLRAITATGAPVQAFDISTTNGNIPYDQIVNLTRNQRRYVLGANGGFSVFGTDWAWDTYAEHGEGSVSVRIFNMPLKNRFNFAIDSIQLPNGQIVCRDVAARNNGCVPYNPFTTSPANPAAVAYFYNQANGVRLGGPLMRQSMRQEAFSINFSGSPLELWAGKLAVAAGFDYREEAFWQRADPYAGGITSSTPANAVQPCTDPSIDCRVSGPGVVNPGNWNAGNYTSGFGNYHVWELYTEVGVPIFNMPDSIGKLDASIAGRFERYSTAGDFTTWKVGVTWETPLPGVKMRALQSRDVRAPNLSDLFLPKQTLNGSFNNNWLLKATNNASGNGQQIGGTNAGNPLLLPERGQTTEVGIVWQPDFLPGFQTSFDYYRIAIKGIISASGTQTVADLCFQGFQQYCGQDFIATANGQPLTTTLGNTGAKGDPNEVLAIVAVPFNTAGLLTDGFDIESSYQFDLEDWDVPGNFLVRSLVNHTSKFLSDPGIPGQFTQERAGVLGGGFNSDTYSANTGNVLNWKLTEVQSWQGEVWGFNLQERWYSGGVMRGRWTSANNPLGLPNGTNGLHYLTCNPGSCPAPTLQMPTVNYQRVPSVLYLDVGGSYNWNEKTQLYFRVDNIANQTPPNTGGNEVNNTLYDVIGRMYRVGVRINN
jgi:outer membrane receptor protein involved in Fe transport